MRKYLSIILLSFIVHHGFSQSCEESMYRTVELYNSGKIKEAVGVADIVVKNCIGLFTNSRSFATTLHDLATYYVESNNSRGAELFYLKVIEIRKVAVGPIHPDYATALNSLAVLYVNTGNYQKAEPLYLQSLEIRKKSLGELHPDYATSISNLAGLYANLGKFSQAEVLYFRALDIRKKAFGESHASYAQILHNLALMYFNSGDYSKAEAMFLQSSAIRKKVYGEGHPLYAESLDYLGLLYKNIGNNEKAELLFLDALKIRKKYSKENREEYATTLNNLGKLYLDNGDFTKAGPLLIEALNLRETTLGKRHTDYANTLSNLGLLYKNTEKYAKSESLFMEALSIIQAIVGEYHPDYASITNNLAGLYLSTGEFGKADSLYLLTVKTAGIALGNTHPAFANALSNLAFANFKMGRFESAEMFYLKTQEIYKNSLGVDHPDYLLSLNNLATLYITTGNLSKAEVLILQIVESKRETLGDSHPEYALSLNNLAAFYQTIGSYSRAEQIYLQVLEVKGKLYGPDHSEYANTIANLGGINTQMGNFQKAEKLYLQVIEIRKETLGTNHPEFAQSLQDLAMIYFRQEKYRRAEELLTEAIGIVENSLGKEHIILAASLQNLGIIFKAGKNYQKAEAVFQKSLSIYKGVLNELHPAYNNARNNIAGIYADLNQNRKADSLYNISLLNNKRQWRENISFLSQSESSTFLSKNITDFATPLNFLYNNPSADLTSSLFTFNIFLKNALLFSNMSLTRLISRSADSAVLRKWEQLKELRYQISSQYQVPLTQQKNLERLEYKAEVLEKELMRFVPEFQKTITTTNVTWKDIQAQLKPNEAVVDFVNFAYYNNGWVDTTIYAAFVLLPGNNKPKFISLFREDQLIRILDNGISPVKINSIYRGSNEESINDNSYNSLYSLIWQPLDSLLDGMKYVYVSPSGLIHRISFSAIPTPDSKRLIDRFDIRMMSNIRVIAEKPNVTTTIKSLSLFGGIDYDQEPSTTITGKIEFNSTDSLFAELRKLRGSKWVYLPGTSNEVELVKKIAESRKIPAMLYSYEKASEESFKQLSKDVKQIPSIIHIATHGFAFANPPIGNTKVIQYKFDAMSPVFSQSQDPLTRAGLVMSGGNKIWLTGVPYHNREDGILTAREISNLDLRGCTLTTLSACETGLGEIKGSEGVFGLQRAFKMAGVKNLIVSLWQVPDKETAEFMGIFYTNWLINNQPIREAFRNTQLKMNEKYKPYQWAAFVLLE